MPVRFLGYKKISNHAIEYAKTGPEYIDEVLDRRDTLFRYDEIPDSLLSMTPRQVVEEWKNEGRIDSALSVKEPVKENTLGGRFMNLFYGDFILWLEEKYGVTEEKFSELFGEYEANCAQYAAFMTTLLGETLPELSPTIFYGDARVMRGGVFNEKRMDHFWIALSNGMLLDNSGVHHKIFDDLRPLACNDSFNPNKSYWKLIDDAIKGDGWYRVETINTLGGFVTKNTVEPEGGI